MKRMILLLVCVFLPFVVSAFDKINIVTTSTDLADIASAIGGDDVNVKSLAKGSDNPHAVEPRPSMAIAVRNADLVIRTGMDLDMWLDSLLDAARNSKVSRGGAGYLDVSNAVEKLEVPSGKIDASMGDIHVYGNPHYWLDPENGKIIAEEIAKKMSDMMPERSGYFGKNLENFKAGIDESMKVWQEKLKQYKGQKIVTYHASWPYFAKRFGFEVAGYIELKPGIPPTPSHVLQLESMMKAEKVKIIMMEPYFDAAAAEKVAQDTGAKVVIALPSVNAAKGAGHYQELFEHNVNELLEAFK